MVSIKSIRIRNFRSIVDETIKLTGFNFFVGRNDCGKSNVLKALNLFFNNQTDHNTPYNFQNDYSLLAKRSEKQAREISITLGVEIPETFRESGLKYWTKTWRADEILPHFDNVNELFESGSKGLTLLNRIIYTYTPAVKSIEYFKDLLARLYSSMVSTANSTLREVTDAYSEQLQDLTSDLSVQIKTILKMNSALRMPQNLNLLFRDLQFSTSDQYVSGVDLNQRGDGIKARHIPSIIQYMQRNLEDNKLRGAISYSFIWGFEEPENGVEYNACYADCLGCRNFAATKR